MRVRYKVDKCENPRHYISLTENWEKKNNKRRFASLFRVRTVANTCASKSRQ